MFSQTVQQFSTHGNSAPSSPYCGQQAQQRFGVLRFGPCITPPNDVPRLIRENMDATSDLVKPSLPEFDSKGNDMDSESSTVFKSRVRRRTSRACDRCSQRRTKCNGRHPCSYCIGKFDLFPCEYAREKKKRGKGSEKYLARKDATFTTSARTAKNGGSPLLRSDADPNERSFSQAPANLDYVTNSGFQGSLAVNSSNTNNRSIILRSNVLEVNGADDGEISNPSSLAGNHHVKPGTGAISGLVDLVDMAGQPSISGDEISWSDDGNGSEFLTDNRPLNGTPALNVLFSPSRTTSSHQGRPPLGPKSGILTTTSLRYPVLGPLAQYLEGIISLHHAGDLLDHYFSSPLSTYMHPTSPHVLGFVFRKRAFMHRVRPRKCKPALLASILWTAAQTSDSNFLAGSPTSRAKVCQSLLDLTLRLLAPPNYAVNKGAPEVTATSGTNTESAVYTMSESAGIATLVQGSSTAHLAGELDDVATYAHLATVISASEYKGASIRWWNNAWSLARELKLGREIPASAPRPFIDSDETESEDLDEHDMIRNRPGYVSEEEREERRRLWWLLYMVDRHTALCYNRALFLLDADCEGLLQPMDENTWQNGEFKPQIETDSDANSVVCVSRPSGPQVECTGNGVFGFFLPLMTILGEIVDLRHMKNHPRFGTSFQVPSVQTEHFWDQRANEIRRHLQTYELSLQSFQGQEMTAQTNWNSSGKPAYTDRPNHRTRTEIPDQMAVSYGTFVMHVLHILLEGKWDPIDLLTNSDLWISSTSFVTATNHAMSAAEAANRLLEIDSGLNFMPFFLGIYLFQGSFLPIMIAEKLSCDTSPDMIKACETMLRANETCIVTLNTEYQVGRFEFPRESLRFSNINGSRSETLSSSCVVPCPLLVGDLQKVQRSISGEENCLDCIDGIPVEQGQLRSKTSRDYPTDMSSTGGFGAYPIGRLI
ncbi:transcriptional activator xlnR [Purpureocillium lilacinum]|uniref:Transcriptional activator xlnR n=1 Tax=Purpureocillium lilacinum TaxID=33203 RepID=A0A179EY57_PURLI|nr:transcriptional activator xlnR [Purpureocillium lilacinum]